MVSLFFLDRQQKALLYSHCALIKLTRKNMKQDNCIVSHMSELKYISLQYFKGFVPLLPLAYLLIYNRHRLIWEILCGYLQRKGKHIVYVDMG